MKFLPFHLCLGLLLLLFISATQINQKNTWIERTERNLLKEIATTNVFYSYSLKCSHV